MTPEQRAAEVTKGVKGVILEAQGTSLDTAHINSVQVTSGATELLRAAIAKAIKEAVGKDREERMGFAESVYNIGSMTRGQLEAALRNELHDIGVLVENVGIVYDHVTGGTISKPFTDPEDVKSAHDVIVAAETDRAVNEAVKEYRESDRRHKLAFGP